MAPFTVGVLHPLLVPSHLVALVGLGLLAGRGAAPAAAVLAAFAVGLATGLGAIAWGIGETASGDVVLAVAALSGLFAAVGVTIPLLLAAPLALAAGAAIGLDSPPEAIQLRDAVLTLIGTACGAVAALAVTTMAAAALVRLGQGIPARVAGSWVAAIAILVLALRWAG